MIDRKNTKYILILITSLLRCEHKIEDPYAIFVIPAGKHDSKWRFESLQSRTLKFVAIFDQSAIYQTDLDENQYDINKLMGFSDCNSFHHENSARFGWRWLDRKLEIHAYAYVGGERITEYIGDVSLDTAYDYQLQITSSNYVFYLHDHNPVRISRNSPCDRGLYYMLFPYFGGDETAPQDISIQVLTKY